MKLLFFKLTTNLTNSLLMAAAEEAIIDSSILFINFYFNSFLELKFEKEQDKERAGVIIGSMNSNIPRLTDSISGAALKVYIKNIKSFYFNSRYF